jgi:superfamily II DNA or RNA helicase/HKD family nuclease
MSERQQGKPLPEGIYEALLTHAIRRRLPATSDLSRFEPIGVADAPGALSAHFGRILNLVLRSLGDDVASQVAISNDLIREMLAKRPELRELIDELVSDEAKRLTEILRPASTPLGRLEPLPRPAVGLSQNALLVSAQQEPVLSAELRHELASADSVSLLCAFVRWSGIRVLLPELRSARSRGVRIRVLTTTYTGSTEARALDELNDLGAEIKVSYDLGSTRLHAKAWLFERSSGYSTAYVGSSNLTHTALHDGLEWNVRLSEVAAPDLLDRFRAAFETYWADPNFEPYVQQVFEDALARARPSSQSTDLVPFDLRPYPFQEEMLYTLEVERKRFGRWRNLIVAATGTGKTVVSAFDFQRVRQEWGDPSLLFVAHRQEILQQSMATFRNVLRDGSFGELMVAGQQPRDGKHVFASIQSLASVLRRDAPAFQPDAYDVVIVDEFHHAEAPTYRRLLDHLSPRLLVGMTATPERADGLDIKRWFDGHVAVELRLWDALEQGLLCPFQYFGVADGTDLRSLRWSRGGYDAAQLNALLTGDDMRLTKVVKAVRDFVLDPNEMRALGFCVSIEHAKYMASRFTASGIASTHVSGQSTAVEREGALRDLRTGAINALFSVDVFNEGLDIPDVDTVLLLRPTESPVVFMQQIGRGLRRTSNKDGLTILDFIGQQHRRFRYAERLASLTGLTGRRLQDEVEAGFPYLPAGCSMTLDRQSQQLILENLRTAAHGRRSELVEQLRAMGDSALDTFLRETGLAPTDIYSGSTPGWTMLRRSAGFAGSAGPDEAGLSSALSRMLHIDDPLRVSTYTEWLSRLTPPSLDALPPLEMRLATMLHFDLRLRDKRSDSLAVTLERLWAHPAIRDELRQLLAVLAERARHLAPPAQVPAEVPLSLHSKYTRDEILAAFGSITADRPGSWREGVKWLAEYRTDLLLVTLNKSEKRFSPSTRYRDYPISPELFHWESQSVTSAASPTGQRYLHQRRDGTSVLLFVREDSIGDGIGASPFLFLGAADYERHERERPIAIVWRLRSQMPPDFFKSARAVA